MSSRLRCLLLALGVLSALGASAAAASQGEIGRIEFLAPGEGFGQILERFRISSSVRFSAPVSGQIVLASVNGIRIFQAGSGEEPGIDTFDADKHHLGGERLDGQREIIVQFYFNWATGEPYALSLTVQTKEGETVTYDSQPAVAPKGGAWRSDLPKFKVVSIKDTSGIDRKNWPVIIGLSFSPAEVKDPRRDLFLVRYDKAAGKYLQVPFQVLDSAAPKYVAENASIAGAGKDGLALFDICFLTDVEANSTSLVFLYYGKPESGVSQPAFKGQALEYTGEGFGVTVNTGPVVFRFDPKCGQLLSYRPTFTDSNRELTFVQKEPRPIHWNPDVWAPPSPWGHVSDWGSEKAASPQVVRSRGAIAFRTVRTGTMPNANGVKASVSYTLFAGMPFILESSLMEFTEPTEVNAVRHNELVFSRGVHSHAVWCDLDGKVTASPCYDPAEPNRFLRNIAKLSPDVPWLGFFNEQHRHGICFVNLSRFNYAAGGGDPQDFAAHYYISDPGIFGTGADVGMNFTYLCRPEVYHHTVIPKGAIYAEHSAILVFGLSDGEDQFAAASHWAGLLREPPKIEVR